VATTAPMRKKTQLLTQWRESVICGKRGMAAGSGDYASQHSVFYVAD
jgi:hypothetical protein